MSLQESVIAQESPITAGEFEAAYAATVGTTVAGLHATGRAAERCSCDWDRCRGWVLGYLSPRLASSPEPFGLPE
jgi:hypothetical protein